VVSVGVHELVLGGILIASIFNVRMRRSIAPFSGPFARRGVDAAVREETVGVCVAVVGAKSFARSVKAHQVGDSSSQVPQRETRCLFKKVAKRRGHAGSGGSS